MRSPDIAVGRSRAARQRFLFGGIAYVLLVVVIIWGGNLWASARAAEQAGRLSQSSASGRASLLISELSFGQGDPLDDVAKVGILLGSLLAALSASALLLARNRHYRQRRAEDAPATIEKRLLNARTEIQRWSEYDYVIVNDDLQNAFTALQSILTAERLKRTRQIGISEFAAKLV